MIVFIFLIIYGTILSFFVLFGIYKQLGKENNYVIDVHEKEIHLNELVVIIPFRNEEHRLSGLIESIKKSKHLPNEFIFVNDHSTDKSVETIDKKLKKIPHRIIHLSNEEAGKKIAIRKGIQQSESKYILSMDADIRFGNEYFSALEHLENADMYILPAILEAEKWNEYFFETDLDLANAVNAGISGFKRPFLASGANLLYKRETFERVDHLSVHAHMKSGDDIYLLRDFRNANCDVRLMTNFKLAVHTETPKTYSEFIHQRLRWISKTGDVADNLSTITSIVQAIFTFAFVALLIYAAVMQEWKHFFILFFLKTGIDMMVFLPYFNRIRRMRTWFTIPVYEIIFPFYSLILLSMMFWFKPVWKDRKL